MRIVSLIGSPRKGGNTDILVDTLVDELVACGVIDPQAATKVYLYDHEVRPCVDCRVCKKGDLRCALRDDMPALYAHLEQADLIVFGTPVYWYGPTAKMKLLIDRLRPYIANRALAGKRAVVVVPSEEGEACCGPLVDLFRMSCGYLDVELAGAVLASAYEKGEVLGRPEELAKARALAAELAGG